MNLHDNVKRSITYYNSQFNNARSINELLEGINNKLSKYERSFSNKEKQVQTSYRKTTYYETDIKNIETANSISYFIITSVFQIFLDWFISGSMRLLAHNAFVTKNRIKYGSVIIIYLFNDTSID